MNSKEMMTEEQNRLDETFGEIAKQLSELPPAYYGNEFVERLLDDKRKENQHRLETLQKNPYFGRIDFQGFGEPVAQFYIGKRGMDLKENGEQHVIDWRAPFASLFYSFTGGDEPVSYSAPEGTVVGEIHRKRNIAIHENKIDRVVESYVRGGDNVDVSDEFLLYKLGEKKDNQLRDIVTTIQGEQDKIIRAPLNVALMIQGAAGSGKTTVALHRLAFLLYHYQGQLRADRMIIFAPNTMFLEYISGVLPELGVGNVRQTTFVEWALEVLGPKVKFNYMMNTDSKWLAFGGDSQSREISSPAHMKGTLDFKNWLDVEIDKFEENYLPEMPFEAWDSCVLEVEEIRGWFLNEFSKYSIVGRRERVAGRIKRWMNIQLKEMTNLTLKKERSRMARQRLNAYLKKFPSTDAIDFYKKLFYKMRSEGDHSVVSFEVVESTCSVLKSGYVLSEDLAPLVWIHRRFNGVEDHFFSHVVVDEAQDASPFMIEVMNGYMREPSFTILGDLAQGIYAYRGIRKWEELTNIFSEEQTSYHELRRSYRSTFEIIQFANQFIAQTGTGLPPALPVFRSGEPVKIIPFAGVKEQVDLICDFIQEQQKNEMKSIAIIGRTNEECEELKKELSSVGVEAHLITEGQQHYLGGITIVPVHLSKGLEFDAVLITDADEFYYSRSQQNAKLLYVGCTRALHRLVLLYSGNLSSLITECD